MYGILPTFSMPEDELFLQAFPGGHARGLMHPAEVDDLSRRT
jgi:hypothetical protein